MCKVVPCFVASLSTGGVDAVITLLLTWAWNRYHRLSVEIEDYYEPGLMGFVAGTVAHMFMCLLGR